MKKLAILMSVMMLIGLTTTLASAKTQKTVKMTTLSGEVVKVDAEAGSITVSANNKDHALKASPKILEGITVGEKVSIEMTGNTVKSIKKVEAALPAAEPK